MEQKQNNITPISALGEFGLIDYLTSDILTNTDHVVKGVGDDAAVLRNKENELTVVTTDMLVEGIHFDLSYTPLMHLGYKAVMVNLSDICAMNAVPQSITVSLALSSKFSVEAVNEIYSGIKTACNRYNVSLIGGDTTSSRSGLVLSITAIGSASETDLVYRSNAKPGDIICVTGDLGAAFLGLQVLEREKRVYLENPAIQPELTGYDYMLERQLKPEARVDMRQMFAKLEIKPTSMIDVSDGLTSELFHICKSSGVGCQIFEDKLPIDPVAYNLARSLNLDPTTCMLNGGEDYELLFTVDPISAAKLENNPDVSLIGKILSDKSEKSMISKSGNKHDLVAQGWKAF